MIKGSKHAPGTRFRGKSFEERLFGRLVVSETGCHEWQGKLVDGYGQMMVDGKMKRVHRLVWTIAYGDPGELHVLHTCDNRRCARLDHLFLGTNADNQADKASKRRSRNGESDKIRCKRGHEFDTKNTYWWHGERHCRICRRERTRAYRNS